MREREREGLRGVRATEVRLLHQFYSLTTGLDYLLLRCTGTTGGRIQVCVKQQVYIKSEGSLVRGKLFGKSAKNGVNAQN
jgi:hypothetical protein